MSDLNRNSPSGAGDASYLDTAKLPRMSAYGGVCQIAQNLARNCGYCVFPCREDKTPATPHGFKNAARDREAIATLWRCHPGPFIGIATGAMSGAAVLDVDVKHDTARAWWRRHEHRLPATRTCRTRSGGLHLYFTHMLGIRCASARPVPGVDVRGDGGYVIFWFGAGHECLDHTPPQPFPAWLRHAIWPPAPPLQRLAYASATRGAQRRLDGVLARVRGAPEGERNSVLHWGAHRTRELCEAGAISQADAERDLLAAARECGLAQSEAQRTIASAWRAA